MAGTRPQPKAAKLSPSCHSLHSRQQRRIAATTWSFANPVSCIPWGFFWRACRLDLSSVPTPSAPPGPSQGLLCSECLHSGASFRVLNPLEDPWGSHGLCLVSEDAENLSAAGLPARRPDSRPESRCSGFLAALSTLRTQIHLFMFFNVVNGQLNELQFVIFMVNLKSRSRWLILLVGSKTRGKPCSSSSNSDRHFMLNYGHRLEQKARPDFRAEQPRRVRAACGRQSGALGARSSSAPSHTGPTRLCNEEAAFGTRLCL